MESKEMTVAEMEALRDEFFHKTACDRCGGSLRIRTMSWFTNEVICNECSEKEMEIKQELHKRGLNPSDYEGCGKVPELKG